MRGVRKPLLALALAALLAVGLAACGGGSDDSTSTSAGANTSATTTTAAPEKDGGSGGANGSGKPSAADDGKREQEKGSASFVVPGGDNSVQNYGDEPGQDEIEAAEEALAAYLDARAEADWSRACVYLGSNVKGQLQAVVAKAPQYKGKGCGAVLGAFSAGLPTVARVNTMTNGLGSLRVDGDRGFALYHGSEGIDYFIPMSKEDGVWKVGGLAPSEIARGTAG